MNNDDRSSLAVPPRDGTTNNTYHSTQSQAAANVVRSQIDSIFQNDEHATAPVANDAASHQTSHQNLSDVQPQSSSVQYPQPSGSVSNTTNQSVSAGPGAVANNENPYGRSMSEEATPEVTKSAWQQYHSAWQSYYQQYYSRYYVAQVDAAQKKIQAQARANQMTVDNAQQSANDGTMTEDEAIKDLRSSIRKKVNDGAKKVRNSRHFMPAMAAVVVMLVFVFLQYNRVFFAYVEAYVAPGANDDQSIIVSPTSTDVPANETTLLVPKIAVDVPIVWNADPSSLDSLNQAMNNGVAWFGISGANAKPGEKGNFALSGHSSNDWTDGGNYKFIFARLDKMSAGDIVYVNYKGTRYTYKVTGTKVVKPTDVSALQLGTDKPYITLITCTPLGTALNRLLVFGEQISPDPDKVTSTQPTTSSSSATKMPSNSPTFLQKLFGIGSN